MCGNDEASGYDVEFIVLCNLPSSPEDHAESIVFISKSTWTPRHKHGSLKGLKPSLCVAARPSLICECVLVQCRGRT